MRTPLTFQRNISQSPQQLTRTTLALVINEENSMGQVHTSTVSVQLLTIGASGIRFPVLTSHRFWWPMLCFAGHHLSKKMEKNGSKKISAVSNEARFPIAAQSPI